MRSQTKANTKHILPNIGQDQWARPTAVFGIFFSRARFPAKITERAEVERKEELRSNRDFLFLGQAEMEALLVNHLRPFTHANSSTMRPFGNRTLEDPKQFQTIPNQRQVNKHMRFSRFTTQSKQTPIQDFQDFAKPSRVLQTTEANLQTKYVPEEVLSSLELDIYNSYYIIELCTSKDFGSSLKDINAAILLCLIDENGNTLLQRLSAISLEYSLQEKDMDSSESIHFQRGSVDIVTFKGSKLGKIEALWIGLESGSWRLDGVHLTVINGPLYPSEFIESKDDNQFDCLQYKFEANNLLLGEQGISVAQMRPILTTQLSRNSFSTSLNMQSLSETILLNTQITKEESMKEYADLKFSLLVYDLLLISGGSSILNFFVNEKAAYAFLAGGFGGFFYLLLLQRSVDGLYSPANNSKNAQNFMQIFGGLKRQWLTLALAVVVSAAALKYQIGGTTIALSPTELFTGVAGFLSSKVAVVLAAFRPVQRNQKNI
ncbi:hypothetical protein Cni_G20460 [Canna indica]|uniref:DUF7755 domain-containing protein n=1 Tax=Canna indica TaxID=4628 RepID=A0AAQ3KT97_9LILI|nr:hypothetical protein Cni_G20460 [Canna indica]